MSLKLYVLYDEWDTFCRAAWLKSMLLLLSLWVDLISLTNSIWGLSTFLACKEGDWGWPLLYFWCGKEEKPTILHLIQSSKTPIKDKSERITKQRSSLAVAIEVLYACFDSLLFNLISQSLVLFLIHSRYWVLPPIMGKAITSGTLQCKCYQNFSLCHIILLDPTSNKSL